MKAVKEIVRKYYKYVDTPWVQPHTMVSNGTLGGDYFACWQRETNRGDFYYCINGNAGYYTFWYNTINNGEFILYNPKPFKISAIQWIVYDSNRNPTNYTVQGSDNGSSYTNIIVNQTAVAGNETNINLSSNTTNYRYYKIIVNSFNTAQGNCKTCNITATERTVTEGSSSDYDFYEDVDEYKVPKISDTYYGVNQ